MKSKIEKFKYILLGLIFIISAYYTAYFYIGAKYRAKDFSEFNFNCFGYGCDLDGDYRNYEISEFELAISNAPYPSFVAKITESRKYYIFDKEYSREEFLLRRYLFYVSIIVNLLLITIILSNMKIIIIAVIVGASNFFISSNNTNSNGKIAYLIGKQNLIEQELSDRIDELQNCCEARSTNQRISISYY